MGLKSSFLIAWRSLSRRKTKSLSAILAVTLGVTLLVGIQITTATLENAFLSTLLQTEGEVDLRVSNSTSSGYLKAIDQSTIADLIPEAVGIMPELTTRIPALIDSQFDPKIAVAGIPPDYTRSFGDFFDWKTGEKLDLEELLTNNQSILLSSNQAEKMGLLQNSIFPITLKTELVNFTITMVMNETSGMPIYLPQQEILEVDLQIVGIFDSNRPGIGSQYRGALFALEDLQQWISLENPNREVDLVSAYLVAYKINHFVIEIDEEFLRTKVELLEEAIPEKENIETGKMEKIYQVNSVRLNFFSFAEFFITLMSTILLALGFLIMSTGVLLITNVQLMSVEDREFQTGVMRAVGENRTGIFQSIIIENLFQGIIGGIIGFFGGLVFGQAVAVYLVGLFGTGELSIQPVISKEIVALSVIVGVVLSIITGILPALRASRVNIVEALRGIKIKFEEKSSRNLVALGFVLTMLGIFFLLYNGIIDGSTQVLWSNMGWDTLEEWRTLLLGFGFLTGGMGIILSRFINRVKAFNITAISLWTIPSVLFVIAMGNWITDIGGFSPEILILGIIEIIIGSIMFVALNLPFIMRGLRSIIIRIKWLKGVGQISPSLISSHITRSTLTFAIFAVILTLNVIVATLIPTNLGNVTQIEEDSRGIDLYVYLNKPEPILNNTSYTMEIYKIDHRITDVIGLKTFQPERDFTKFVALKNPLSLEFDPSSDFLPIGMGEFKPEQIRGNATDYSDLDWRYDFYLDSFPDEIRPSSNADLSDDELLELSRKSWDKLFSPEYTMASYNVSSGLLAVFSGQTDLSDLQLDQGFGAFDSDLEDASQLKDDEGNVIRNPIVFTDSMLLPVGLQIWIPMNTSSLGYTNYQAFTIGGRLDSQRAGGFPLASGIGIGSGEFDISSILGKLYLPQHWAEQTNFLGEANGQILTSRKPYQYNDYLIKTSLVINDPEIQEIGQAIEDFTNTNNQGYRLLANDNFLLASASLLYERIETTLELTNNISSFLQIYVTFGLIIGAVGMGVISVRNVAERKREIGMMRAIGFPRKQVMLSVLLELVILGIIGLMIGIVNGLLVSVGFANMQNVALVIPWEEIGLYLTFIVLIAIGAGSVPAYIASRIPPAEALRYVG